MERDRRGVALALALAVALGACARSVPAPVEYKGSARGETTVAVAPAPGKDAAPVPRPKPEREARDEAGDEDGLRTIVVRRGDTLYDLARRYNVSARALIARNDLAPPYELAVGQRLHLPPSRTYIVAEGDTIYGISRRFGVDMASLVRANDIAPPYTITVGQRLHVPGGAVIAAVAPETAVAADGDRGGPPAAARFEWPLKGRVVSTFGPKPGGLHNDGINIAAERGAPVRAAMSGIVAYAGNELRGFGDLVLIRHADGWVTAYGHNEGLLVGRGDEVRRGQIIGRVGATGGVTTPQLHFEIRKGIEAVDPLEYLSDLSAAVSLGPRPGGRPALG